MSDFKITWIGANYATDVTTTLDHIIRAAARAERRR